MEPEVVGVKRRGRKRKINNVQNVGFGGEVKRQTRSKALVGSYLKKEFEGYVYLGKVVRYERGLYRVEYEDEDSEDFDSSELKLYLIKDDEDGWSTRKKELDKLIMKKYEKERAEAMRDASVVVNDNAVNEVEKETNGVIADDDSSSDSGEYAVDGALCFEAEACIVPPPELPPSTGNIGVPDECVADLLSVYAFLRSFSVSLFLSPFGLDDFVGSLKCSVQNTLLDAIHVALMRVVHRHFEALSSDGSELAAKCLRSMDWSLIDSLTWPVFIVQYMMMMGYTEGLEWKGLYVHALQRDYYCLSVGRKLMILQILCDDALDSAELRTEIDMREESEVEDEVDREGVTITAPQYGPRRVHPRYSKTSACKDQEATMDAKESHEKRSSDNISSLGYQDTKSNTGADVDQDSNSDECRLCGMDGTLLCCDGCPSAYHSRCIGVSKMFIPEGDWYCPECTINKISPTITRETSLKGADFFGVDSYDQVFLGTCDHLLVIKVSMNSEQCVRYYQKEVITVVLQALLSSAQHRDMYSGLCEKIMDYWEIPEDVLSVVENPNVGVSSTILKDGASPTTAFSSLDKSSGVVSELPVSENIASCIAESSSGDIAGPVLEKSTRVPESSKAFMDTITQLELPAQEPGNSGIKQGRPTTTTNIPEQIKMAVAISSVPLSQQGDPSNTNQLQLLGRSNLMNHAMCNSGINNSCNKGQSNGTCIKSFANMCPQGEVANCAASSRGCGNIANGCFYVGSNFKAHSYINHYIHGDFAASAAANLSTVSSEETHVLESNTSNSNRKVISANILLQTKAFSSAANRFFWPNSEKKLIEVPRERCGWCISCKGVCHSKRGCLLNAAASSAIKGTMKILAGIRPVKHGEGSLHSIATYVLYIEESLRGLTVGPFKSLTYRNKWCKQAERASTCCSIKGLLLELEENIHHVAFIGDWVRLVDGWSVESSANNSTITVGSSQKRGPGRRGRKPAAMPEVTADDEINISDDFVWWRGGMLSKVMFQKGTLPRTIVRYTARQGGSRKISGIYYAEGVEVPKRSRRFIWRAAVEMSRNTSQLAAQIRYLDIHVRWSDLVRPEQSSIEGKGAETEAYVFRNASICDKQILESKTRYAVSFGNQKHLPSRIMKNVNEVEKSEDGIEKYWFLETRIPLYLIKEYEEKMKELPLPKAEKPMNVLSELQRRQLKVSRKDIFSYLMKKRDNLDSCLCASCQFDVFLGNAVKCSTCEGYCHFQCTVSTTAHMKVEDEFVITCKSCYQSKAIMHNEKHNVSPTIPLLSQRQKPLNAPTAVKSEKQNGCNRTLASNGSLSHSVEKNHASNSKSRSKSQACSWGLIWKKKDERDGTDFRLRNLILKGNSNLYGVECDLCMKPYNPNLTYIRCETCTKWFHADAVKLDESQLYILIGFKCCKCRRIKSPSCPYSDPQDCKKSNKRAPKQTGQLTDSCPESISEPFTPKEPAAHVLPVKKELVCIKGDNPLTFSLSRVDHGTAQTSEVALGQNPTLMCSVPQKLPVRRHMKQEDDFFGSSTTSTAYLSTPIEGNTYVPAVESSPCLEWDASTNTEDALMFDAEGLNYEDMEFEPQTYFSFNELLAFDDGTQLDGVDPSGNLIENIDNSSILPGDAEPSFEVVPCQICSQTDPIPDRCCELCGFCMHSHCSPWVEESSNDGAWRCGNCQGWQ